LEAPKKASRFNDKNKYKYTPERKLSY
jgi:hypothetical protein